MSPRNSSKCGRSPGSEAGASLRELMERMGHSSSRAALIYLHSTDDRQRTLAEAVSERARRELAGESRGTRVARDGHTMTASIRPLVGVRKLGVVMPVLTRRVHHRRCTIGGPGRRRRRDRGRWSRRRGQRRRPARGAQAGHQQTGHRGCRLPSRPQRMPRTDLRWKSRNLHRFDSPSSSKDRNEARRPRCRRRSPAPRTHRPHSRPGRHRHPSRLGGVCGWPRRQRRTIRGASSGAAGCQWPGPRRAAPWHAAGGVRSRHRAAGPGRPGLPANARGDLVMEHARPARSPAPGKKMSPIDDRLLSSYRR